METGSKSEGNQDDQPPKEKKANANDAFKDPNERLPSMDSGSEPPSGGTPDDNSRIKDISTTKQISEDPDLENAKAKDASRGTISTENEESESPEGGTSDDSPRIKDITTTKQSSEDTDLENATAKDASIINNGNLAENENLNKCSGSPDEDAAVDKTGIDIEKKTQGTETGSELDNKEILELQNELRKKEKEIEKLKTQLQEGFCGKLKAVFHLERKPKSTILLYSKRQDDLIKTVVKDLENMLNSRIKNVIFELCHNIKNRLPKSPVLVLCISDSRIAADARDAIKDIQLSELEHTALILLHHKDIHALSFTPSNRALTDPPFPELYGIYDIAFLQEKGIYHCGLNEKAITDIVSFLSNNFT